MNTTTIDKTAHAVDTRILREGYGEGAWHGPDLKAALDEITPGLAFRRPAPGRHNIAEVAVHHAYCVRNVRAKLTGKAPERFVLDGDDWFELDDASRLSWSAIADLVRGEQQKLADCVGDIAAGRTKSPLSDADRFDLVLGITCHAVYHAGQVQLVKRLLGA